MSDRVVLGLGSNQGDRLRHLRSAVNAISQRVLDDVRVSPVIETAAWLKPGAPAEWDLPFLNMVVEGRARLSSSETLKACLEIEQLEGRGQHAVWSPRPLDIDVLAWGDKTVSEPGLEIPHPGASIRPFVLDPWVHLSSSLRVPGFKGSVLETRRGLAQARPLLMAIVNITPDSFSDGGQFYSEASLTSLFRSLQETAPSIIDLGGQSTRPGAQIVGADEEWLRLRRALGLLQDAHAERVRPWVSIDTFRPELAVRAIDWGVEIINDVSGLKDPSMVELAAGTKAHFVFMHHVGIPVDRTRHLPTDRDPVEQVMEWALGRLDVFAKAGVDFDRLIFDPGIGFGKTAAQSLTLIRRAAEFKKLPVRVLFGHSRKSYQSKIDPSAAADREGITLAHSLHLAHQGIEILRVHNPKLHRSALLADEQLGAPK